MKRFFNFRPLLWIFLTCIGAVYSVIKIFLGNYIPIIILGVVVLGIISLLIANLIKNNIFKAFFEHFGIKSLKIFCLTILCATIISSGLTILSYQLNSKRSFENATYQISAKVKEIDDSNNANSLLLGNVLVNGENQNFKILASTNSTDVNVGDEISFEGYLIKRELVQNGNIQTYLLKTKAFYYCSIDESTLHIEKQSAGIIDSIKAKTKSVLQENMSEENAGFAYALLVGDKSILSENYYSTFKNAGLAHVLAVSGLHVGFLVALIEILLKLCKVKSKYRFFILVFVLLVYNILCNFSPSVFRASIMSICLLLGLVLGERNDMLSNISLAGIIILAVMPLYLFDVGFLLSFSSVFGIVFFAKPISNLLSKIKFPNLLAESIAVTISATIGTVPFVFKFFGEFAPISIISNLLVLPLFSIMFAVLILCTFINLMINLPFLMSFSQFFVNIVANFSFILSKFGMISTLSFDEISIILYYTICVIFSPYFSLSAKSKLIASLGFIICLSGTVCMFSAQKIIKNNSIYMASSSMPSSLYTTESGKTIFVNLDSSSNMFSTKNFLKDLKLYQIDYLLLFNYKDELQINVAEIANTYNVENVYVFGDYPNSTKAGLISALYKTKNVQFCDGISVEIENFKLEIFMTQNTAKALKISHHNAKILHILKDLSKTEISNNHSVFCDEDYDLCITTKMKDIYKDINSKVFIVKNSYTNMDGIEIKPLVDDKLWTYFNNYATIMP